MQLNSQSWFCCRRGSFIKLSSVCITVRAPRLRMEWLSTSSHVHRGGVQLTTCGCRCEKNYSEWPTLHRGPRCTMWVSSLPWGWRGKCWELETLPEDCLGESENTPEVGNICKTGRVTSARVISWHRTRRWEDTAHRVRLWRRVLLEIATSHSRL